MDLVLIIKAAVALSAIGLVAAGMLAAASRRFHVEVDPRIETVFNVLPGANCGACGNPSCFGAAEALAAGDIAPNACTAGGQATADAVAEMLGVEKVGISQIISLRHCGGGRAATRAFDYSGIPSCNAVVRIAGGDLACPYGCLGYGDCMRACPFDAIYMDDRGLPVIDPDKCTGCEVCVGECPRGSFELLKMAPADGAVAVRCSSHDTAKARKAYCSTCCTGCRKCEKSCPADAIHVIDRLAIVDYDKCTGCGNCVDVCPQECIDLHGRSAIASVGRIDGRGPKVDGFKPETQTTAVMSDAGSTSPSGNNDGTS